MHCLHNSGSKKEDNEEEPLISNNVMYDYTTECMIWATLSSKYPIDTLSPQAPNNNSSQ
jgi:hypothetical protein